MSNERIYKCETEGIVSREYDVATLGLDVEELGAAHKALQKAGLVDEGRDVVFPRDDALCLALVNALVAHASPKRRAGASTSRTAGHCAKSKSQQRRGTAAP